MKFSDKVGITEPKSIIQIKGMDGSLRNKLWNAIYIHIVIPVNAPQFSETTYSNFYNFFVNLWHNYYEMPLDTIPMYRSDTINFIRKDFFKCEWFDVYNLIDFIYHNETTIDKRAFKEFVNNILKEELAGYKYVGEDLIPITDESEVKEIEELLIKSTNYKLKGVKVHIESALSLLSNKESPDYRNVIKESISAVESIVQILTGDKNAELGKALGILKEKINIHGALEQGFKKIYGYTSDSDGIRHACKR